MKKSRWADWFLTAGFLGFLALALAVTLIRPKSGWSYYENRNLAHPAELSVETLLDGTFPASVEPVLQDHAAGRNTLMKLSVWVDPVSYTHLDVYKRQGVLRPGHPLL